MWHPAGARPVGLEEVHGAHVAGRVEAAPAAADHALGGAVPGRHRVVAGRARGAQLARVVEREPVAGHHVLVARRARLAVGAREVVLPDAVARAASHVRRVLAGRARVAALAVGDAVAVPDALAVARGLRLRVCPRLALVRRVRLARQLLRVVEAERAAGAVRARLRAARRPARAQVRNVLSRPAIGGAGHAVLLGGGVQRNVLCALAVAEAPVHHVLPVVAAQAAPARVRVVDCVVAPGAAARGGLVRARRQPAAAVRARLAAVLGVQVHVVVAVRRARHAVEPAARRAPRHVAGLAERAQPVAPARRAHAVRGGCAVDLRVLLPQHALWRTRLAARPARPARKRASGAARARRAAGGEVRARANRALLALQRPAAG